MKILLIAPTTKPVSGWGTYAKNTEQGLREHHHDVSMLTMDQGLPAPLSLMRSPFSWWQAAKAIAKAVAHHQPDVIHILAEPYALAMPIAARLTTLSPWVMNFHGTYSVTPHVHWLTRRLMQAALRQASGFLVCSNYTFSQIENVLPKTLCHNVTQKTHPIRLAVECSEAETLHEQSVLFVGEMKARKGVLELVRGFQEYRKHYARDAVLHLVGNYKEDGGYIEDIRAHSDNVHIHGRVDDNALQELYGKAGAFAMLSKRDEYNFEGYGLVFLEANARGIPTISSKQSGGAEAVLDGKTGYVVDHNSPEQIAERIHWILDEKRIDPDQCKAWTKAHSIAQQVETCEKLYKSVTT